MKFSIKGTLINAVISCVMLTGIFSSCSDDFTEEDALNAQQTIDLSIYVINYFNTAAVSGANVSIVQDGSTLTSTTNEQGVATFADVKIGGTVPVNVSKDGFTTVQRLANVSTSNFRQGQITETIPILSLTENTGIIKGKLEIESDVTNDDPEVVPVGTEVTAVLDISDLGGINVIEITATTDAEGRYELVVPATITGIDYEIAYTTLTLDQTIAKNGDKGDADFPAVLPTIENISMVFNPRGDSEDIPSVRPVYAIAPPASTGGEDVVFGDVSINGSGEINFISVENAGMGYATSSTFAIAITSLLGGTGADCSFETDTSGELDLINYDNRGMDYPSNSNVNRSDQGPSFDFSVEVASGEILTVNGNYGTGTLRSKEIQ